MKDNTFQIDIHENEIYELSPELFSMLLRDQTLSTEDCQTNIFWATNNYASLGPGYQYNDNITSEAITGNNGGIIKPRSVKSRELQQKRSREMAEVFTPSWICNKQNNLVDNAWFGRDNVFNVEVDDFQEGTHSWIPSEGKISFPKDKTWQEYVRENRLEITCGEAPYLVSRYDTVTGEPIPVEKRIGMLDRKLRIVRENTNTHDEWLEAAKHAYMGTYGYEWQGDNLILARESLLYTFIDNYKLMFDKSPELNILKEIAYIISWNIWQMDGLKCVIPGSCHTERKTVHNLFDTSEIVHECEGCKKGNINNVHKHNGIYCKIRDWKNDETLTFVSLMEKK